MYRSGRLPALQYLKREYCHTFRWLTGTELLPAPFESKGRREGFRYTYQMRCMRLERLGGFGRTQPLHYASLVEIFVVQANIRIEDSLMRKRERAGYARVDWWLFYLDGHVSMHSAS